MTDIETRLSDALGARANLVQPEHLTPSAPVVVLPPSSPWWRRSATLLAVAAVAALVIALPLLAIAVTDGSKSPDRDGFSSDGPAPTTATAPTDEAEGDVDGDGADDRIRVLAEVVDGQAMSLIEVDLSTTGQTVVYDVHQAGVLRIATSADLDGRTGAEVVAVVNPGLEDLHRTSPLVLSLRNGDLRTIIDYQFGAGGDPSKDGTLVYWWVRADELWWWRSQDPVALDETSPYPVDVIRFAHGRRLRAADAGSWCVTSGGPGRLLVCGGTALR